MRIAVCGGTSLGHALAAVLGADPGNEIRLLTRQPERWMTEIRALHFGGTELRGHIAMVTNETRAAVEGAELVLVCTPLQSRPELLRTMAPWVDRGAFVGGIPGFGGFERYAEQALGDRVTIFGLQRVPYVRRTISYGEAVWISGVRPRLFLGAVPSSGAPALATAIEALLGIPTSPLTSYLPVALSASNPIFHPARLVTAFPAPAFAASAARGTQFYEHWDDDASAAYLALDADVQTVAAALSVSQREAVPITRHFGATTAPQLTFRIRAIRALRDRGLPTRGEDRVLDVESRLLNEDACFALPELARMAVDAQVRTPAIEAALDWASRARAAGL